MGQYEVTQEQWRALMGSNPSRHQAANHPVENVSWEDCQQFLARLDEKLPALRASLPTAAQWEYAARAGSTAEYCCGGDVRALAEYAWYYDNSGHDACGGPEEAQRMGPLRYDGQRRGVVQ